MPSAPRQSKTPARLFCLATLLTIAVVIQQCSTRSFYWLGHDPGGYFASLDWPVIALCLIAVLIFGILDSRTRP